MMDEAKLKAFRIRSTQNPSLHMTLEERAKIHILREWAESE